MEKIDYPSLYRTVNRKFEHNKFCVRLTLPVIFVLFCCTYIDLGKEPDRYILYAFLICGLIFGVLMFFIEKKQKKLLDAVDMAEKEGKTPEQCILREAFFCEYFPDTYAK